MPVALRFATRLSAALLVAVILVGRSGSAGAIDLREDFYGANGPVYDVEQVGNTLYLGGDFTRIGPVSGPAVPLDATTGAPLDLPKVVGRVQVVIPDGAGGWFIGGVFSHVKGEPRENLAHLNADGSVAAWNPGANGVVYALTLQGNNLYVGGDFTTVAGVNEPWLSAVDAVTGASLEHFFAGAFAPDGIVRALLAYGRTLYVGGEFTHIGATAYSHFAALNAIGHLGGGYSSFVTTRDNTVYALAADGARVYVGGSFTGSKAYLAAFDTTGSGSFASWSPSLPATVRAIAVAGATVYVGGDFIIDLFGIITRYHLAAFDATSAALANWDPNADDVVYALATDGTTIYAGGSFTSAGGADRNGLVALDNTIGSATPWDPHLSGESGGYGNTVLGLAVDGSTVYAAGGFSIVGGVGRNGLAALDATTGLPLAWDPDVNVNGLVLSLAVSGSTVYVGGGFALVGGQGRTNLAAVNASTGAVLPWTPGFTDDVVSDIEVGGSKVYAAGAFTSIGGQSRSGLASLSAASGAVQSWNPAPNGIVNDIETDGTTIYVGGIFTSIGGDTRNHLAAFDAASGLLATWDPAPNGSDVSDLELDGGLVYAAGSFTSVGGEARRTLAAIDAGTALATSWDPFAGVVSGGAQYVTVSDGRVFVSGGFDEIGGAMRQNLAEVDIATGLATSWDPHPNIPVGLRLGKGSNRVYVMTGSPQGFEDLLASGVCTFDLQTVLGVPPSRETSLHAHLPVRPNPFRATTEIGFTLSRAGSASLHIYDPNGRMVRKLEGGHRAAGEHRMTWDGADSRGRRLAPGAYFVRLVSGGRAAGSGTVIRIE